MERFQPVAIFKSHFGLIPFKLQVSNTSKENFNLWKADVRKSTAYLAQYKKQGSRFVRWKKKSQLPWIKNSQSSYFSVWRRGEIGQPRLDSDKKTKTKQIKAKQSKPKPSKQASKQTNKQTNKQNWSDQEQFSQEYIDFILFVN